MSSRLVPRKQNYFSGPADKPYKLEQLKFQIKISNQNFKYLNSNLKIRFKLSTTTWCHQAAVQGCMMATPAARPVTTPTSGVTPRLSGPMWTWPGPRMSFPGLKWSTQGNYQ